MNLTVTIEKGVNCFGATVEELPGCFSAGNTIEELKENLLEAIEITVDTMIEMGEEPINLDNLKIEYHGL